MSKHGKIVNDLIKDFINLYHSEPEVIVSSPGRLDFLNTHQDYKGLPVVSVGINLRTYVALKKSSGGKAVIESLNLKNLGENYRDEFSLERPDLIKGKWFGNYLRASVITLKKVGAEVPAFKALIHSEVPIASGLASSAALTVAFIGGMNALLDIGLSKKEIAEAAFKAEHDVMEIPCGRLDQYGSAFGGIIKIETKPPYNVEELPWINAFFLAIDSGIKHSTADIHPLRQKELASGLRSLLRMKELPISLKYKLSERIDQVRWEEIDLGEILPYLNRIREVYGKRILFTILNNVSTEIALKIIKGYKPSITELLNILGTGWSKSIDNALRASDCKLALIGLIMNYQHHLLRDLYDLSLPELEIICQASIKAGASGCKLSGAGLGGTLISLAPTTSVADKVCEETLLAGARNSVKVLIDRGLRVENPSSIC